MTNSSGSRGRVRFGLFELDNRELTERLGPFPAVVLGLGRLRQSATLVADHLTLL